jgi:hypothetical protein
MNKKLFVLICSLILFQYINSTCENPTGEEGSKTCAASTESDTKVCELNSAGDACVERILSCAEKTEGATEEICKKLTVEEGKVCKVADAENNKKKCKVESAPSEDKNGANNLKYSLALLIFLFLF